MRVQIRLFHTLKQLAGADLVELDVPEGATLGDVRNLLAERFPALAETVATAMIAQNKEYASAADPALDGAEIALMPPVSGG